MLYNFYINSFIIISILYCAITQFLLPSLSIDKFKISLIDILYVYLFSLISFYLSNKKLIISYLFIIVAVFSFFAIEPLGITILTKPIFFTDMQDLYPSLIEVLPLYMQIITIAATILYFSSLLAFALYFLFRLIKILLENKKKGIILFFIIMITTYLSFFRQVKIDSIYPNYIERVNKFGIINSISYRISFDRENNKITANIDNVKNSIELLKHAQNKRDISNLIMPYDFESPNKRDVFIIFMESFYDYSHFLELFDNDPFPKEYREWASKSAKVGPNDGNGSLFARLSGLIGTSPIYPKKQKSPINTTLPFLMKEAGYKTIALEECGITFNLDKLFPNIGFEEIIFNLGLTNIKNYIKNNDFEEPLFVSGFTFLGHAGSHIKNDLNIFENNKRFAEKINRKDRKVLLETIENSVQSAIDIIETKNIILKKYPDAIIIFKHDHLYPYLAGMIHNSSIDEKIKKEFFESHAVSPLLIWNGKNGAFKLEDGFPPENIPLFIAANTGISYTNSIISLLYKDRVEGIIRFYNNFYTNENNKIVKIEVGKESLSYKYNYAQRIVSEDILRGEKYFNDIITR
ncbi:sulfatase [Brachyspira catarrhinii]|uniref:Sulfatase n=1 Tax=Brachyspira catarrhinii TaxID=2528966 RepID=A0ABY2TT97_9SPIR|nr:sulfatase [Brachyspira catarrhinii]